ncbi:unnamed protein product [Oikopleura dioica]|uniref:Uncharacterized protein n=1 Tax=Oikopleura dioica TaxID=34765 RepID=E4XXY0_OIKDI|nr:unnamed protein product [Oikopleura dioica]
MSIFLKKICRMNKYLKIALVIATTVCLQLALLAAISTILWKASNFLKFWICVAVLAQIIKQIIGFEKCTEGVQSIYRQEPEAQKSSEIKKNN